MYSILRTQDLINLLCILKRVNSYIIDEIIRKGYVGKYLIDKKSIFNFETK